MLITGAARDKHGKEEADVAAGGKTDAQASEGLVADGLATMAEAERFTGLGKSKLYRLMSEGELPSVKIGASRRIPRRALVALAARHLVLPGDRQPASKE